MASSQASLISQELLAVLVCPKCKGELEVDAKARGLVCRRCALLYEVRDGIPIMLVDEARPLSNLEGDPQANE